MNCLVTEDVYVWTLEPHPDGCRVRVLVEVGDDEPGRARLAIRHADPVASLPRLTALAERPAAGRSDLT